MVLGVSGQSALGGLLLRKLALGTKGELQSVQLV